MIAKIITHGPTRAIALSRLRAALEGTQVAGSVTNRDFLGALTRHAGFAAGEVDTGLIGRDLAALTAVAPLNNETLALALLAAVGAGAGPDGFTLWAPLWQSVTLMQGETRHTGTLARDGAGWRVRLGGGEVAALWNDGWWLNGARARGEAVRRGSLISVFGAQSVHFTLPDPLMREAAGGAASGHVLAPMPGLVKAVFVTAGQAVAKGARLAILEAMKMEHTLTAGRDGVVGQVLAAAGDQVRAGAALIVLEDG